MKYFFAFAFNMRKEIERTSASQFSLVRTCWNEILASSIKFFLF